MDGKTSFVEKSNVEALKIPYTYLTFSVNASLQLGVATAVSIIGLMDSFGLFYIGGHIKIFVTRTRGPFWSIRPAPILLVAVFGTQILATLIAVYRLFMPPIGWGWALMVWGYSLPFFLINDRVKVFAYRFLLPPRSKRS